jgi:predicted nucleotidyltransferase component of viral defense system
MERLLARLQEGEGPRWVLKGGVALELRLQDRARATVDLDLSLDLKLANGSPTADRILERLSEAMSKSASDFFRFEIPDSSGIELEIEGLKAHRFSIVSHLAGRVFDRFRLDVVIEPADHAPSEIVRGSGFLVFAGVERETFHVIGLERHFAEKIHAYSRPREARTRVKDLVDILLIDQIGLPAREGVNREVFRVFDERRTHQVPAFLPDPPAEWKTPFEQEARRTGLGPMSLEQASERANRIWTGIRD